MEAQLSVSVADTPATTLLRLREITLSFGGVTALSEVDLDIKQGEIRGIIGPNGAGKSSLINVISGIYRPQRGIIWFAGQSFNQVPATALARLGIARTFQNLALFNGMSVLDNIVTGSVAKVRSSFIEQVLSLPRSKREEADSRDRAEDIIAFLGLQAVRHATVRTLPYGLQKRVELARALAVGPRLLLLDEPMAGMTATEKWELCRVILEARDRFDMTIVLIEHDIGVVMELSHHVAVLDYGRKIADGEPEEVRANQAVIGAYLGVAHDFDAGALRQTGDTGSAKRHGEASNSAGARDHELLS